MKEILLQPREFHTLKETLNEMRVSYDAKPHKGLVLITLSIEIAKHLGF